MADPLATRSRWANIHSCSVLLIATAPTVFATDLHRSCPEPGVRSRINRQSSAAPVRPAGFFDRDMQIDKFATGVGHAADISDALLKTSLVASGVVGGKLTASVAQEVTRILAGTTEAEVMHNRFQCRKRCAAVGPDVGPVGFLLAWRKHLNRCFVSVDQALAQHCFTQRIDQRLEPHAGFSDHRPPSELNAWYAY